MINLESTGLRKSARLDNKPNQKCGLFAKLSLSVIGACKIYNNPHTFITIENQRIQEVNRKFDGNLNNYSPMVFALNQGQYAPYTFKDTLLQLDDTNLILAMIKEVKTNEARSNWKITKNSEVKLEHNNKYGKLKTILSV